MQFQGLHYAIVQQSDTDRVIAPPPAEQTAVQYVTVRSMPFNKPAPVLYAISE